jgi:hypothetical protein
MARYKSNVIKPLTLCVCIYIHTYVHTYMYIYTCVYAYVCIHAVVPSTHGRLAPGSPWMPK